MKKACCVVPRYLQNNVMFDKKNSLNRDNIFNREIELKKEFEKYNYNLSTNDTNKIEDSEIILYFDMPKKLPSIDKISNSYLILVESQLIRPDNYNFEKHNFFSKIFTWHNHLVDNKKYFEWNCSFFLPKNINKDLSKKEKLCVLIAGNKSVNHPLELYSKRVEAIRWFEKMHIKDFDLYGEGWEKFRFKGSIFKGLNRIPYLPQLFSKLTNQKYPSYRGVVDNKKKVMEKYKFSICYENAKDLPGYITEKLFDSFSAGCVPIYWGAKDILSYIPRDCFIDKRDFDSYEKLYEFIRNISDEKYINYLINIEKYLCSNNSFLFSGKGRAKKLVSDILS